MFHIGNSTCYIFNGVICFDSNGDTPSQPHILYMIWTVSKHKPFLFACFVKYMYLGSVNVFDFSDADSF